MTLTRVPRIGWLSDFELRCGYHYVYVLGRLHRKLVQFPMKRIIGVAMVTASLLAAMGCSKPDSIVPSVDLSPPTPEPSLEMRAAAGEVDAQAELGDALAVGKGARKDEAQAVTWWSKAAEAGNTHAQIQLGMALLCGEWVKKDVPSAIKWLERAAESGKADANTALGMVYIYESVKRDVSKGVELIRSAAMTGYPDAQREMGLLYAKGMTSAGGPLFSPLYEFDSMKPLEDGRASMSIVNAYGEGFDATAGGADTVVVEIDGKKAIEWWQKAAEQNDIMAIRFLAEAYEEGRLVGKDPAERARWLTRGADHRIKEAYLYQWDDRGFFDGNVVGTHELYRVNLAGVHASDRVSLARAYELGDGVPRSDSKALELKISVAESGTAMQKDAGVSIAQQFIKGRAPGLDPIIAYAWANLAAAIDPDDSQATKLRDAIARSLTVQQRVESERLAASWKPGQPLRSGPIDQPDSSEGGDLKKASTGTAFFVNGSGDALTNFHVVNSCKKITSAIDGEQLSLSAADEINDLALIKQPNSVTSSLELRVTAPKQGDDVIVFGHPLSSVLSSNGNLTVGTLSALTGMRDNTSQIQITAPIQPGSSGSPVLDRKGALVGIVTSKLSDAALIEASGQIGQNVNFAVNAATIQSFLNVHAVSYKAQSSLVFFSKSNAELASLSKGATFAVECWK